MSLIQLVTRKARSARRLLHDRILQRVMPIDRVMIHHVQLPDFDLLVKSNEIVGRSIQVNGAFEPLETKFFRSLVRDSDIVFDVGGNIGYFSMLFASGCRRGSVHVFEPIPLNASLVETSSILNGFTHVTVNQCAVGDKCEPVAFSISIDSAYSSMIDTGRFAESESIRVPMITIDSYIEANSVPRVDVMKVDVEGAEHLVVEGAMRLLHDQSRRPRLIMLELAAVNLTPFNTSISEILTSMKNLGYEPRQLDKNGALVDYESSASNVYNVFFVTSCAHD